MVLSQKSKGWRVRVANGRVCVCVCVCITSSEIAMPSATILCVTLFWRGKTWAIAIERKLSEQKSRSELSFFSREKWPKFRRKRDLYEPLLTAMAQVLASPISMVYKTKCAMQCATSLRNIPLRFTSFFVFQFSFREPKKVSLVNHAFACVIPTFFAGQNATSLFSPFSSKPCLCARTRARHNLPKAPLLGPWLFVLLYTVFWFEVHWFVFFPFFLLSSVSCLFHVQEEMWGHRWGPFWGDPSCEITTSCQGTQFVKKTKMHIGKFCPLLCVFGIQMQNKSKPSQVVFSKPCLFFTSDTLTLARVATSIRGFEKGLADRGGWRKATPSHTVDSGLFFCVLFPMPPYE